MRRLDVKRILFLAILVMVSCPMISTAQDQDGLESQEWLYGKVVLATGDSLSGALVFHPDEDVVQIASEDGMVNSFSPVNVVYFEVNGVYGGRPQLFRSLFWNRGRPSADFKMPVFFEELATGTLSLLKRYSGAVPKADQQAQATYQSLHYPHFIVSAEELHELYYALLPNGEIIHLKNKKKVLYQLFGDKLDAMKRFVRLNNLDYEHPQQLVVIINYFNSLHELNTLQVAKTKQSD